jgi:hypothetical protein
MGLEIETTMIMPNATYTMVGISVAAKPRRSQGVC